MIEAILFDIDKVLVEIDFTRISHTLAFHSPLKPHVVHYKLLEGETFKEFQCGNISTGEFFQRLRSELCFSKSLDDETFRLIYMSGFKYDSTIHSILYKINRTRIRIGLIANIDSLMWDAFCKIELVQHFFPNKNQHFLSHETGILKPSQELFTRVCDSFGVEQSHILLVDSDTDVRRAFESFGGAVAEYDLERLWPQALFAMLTSHDVMK